MISVIERDFRDIKRKPQFLKTKQSFRDWGLMRKERTENYVIRC